MQAHGFTSADGILPNETDEHCKLHDIPNFEARLHEEARDDTTTEALNTARENQLSDRRGVCGLFAWRYQPTTPGLHPRHPMFAAPSRRQRDGGRRQRQNGQQTERAASREARRSHKCWQTPGSSKGMSGKRQNREVCPRTSGQWLQAWGHKVWRCVLMCVCVCGRCACEGSPFGYHTGCMPMSRTMRWVIAFPDRRALPP